MRFEAMRGFRRSVLGFAMLGAAACGTLSAWAASAPTGAAVPAADIAYRNGFVYTVDAHDSVRQALAVRDGRIVYAGDDAGLARFVGDGTRIVDLHGRMLMPGLVDGHMHPLQGGAMLLKCSLNYERLTIPQMQARIQACLDATKDREPDGWLEVVNWFQEAMQPGGVITSRDTLDALQTRREIPRACSTMRPRISSRARCRNRPRRMT